MGLAHDFLLVPKKTAHDQLWGRGKEKELILESLEVPDDFIQYILDSLQWIPSRNPAKRKLIEQTGLNYYGITLFTGDSAVKMENILSSWHHLFSNAPEAVELTGSFHLSSEKSESAELERMVFDKMELLSWLEELIHMTKRMKEENLYLYHLGV